MSLLHHGSTVVKVLCYKSEGRWFDPNCCQWIFHWYKILPIALWPWGSTQSLTEMSTKSISGGKNGRCIRLTILPPSCAVVMKSGNLNFLGPSGPLQTPLPVPLCHYYSVCERYAVGDKKCTLVQTLRLCIGRTAHRGSTGIALLLGKGKVHPCTGTEALYRPYGV